MDYLLELEKEHSRKNTDAIVKYIGNNQIEFGKIINIIYTAKAPIPQRAAWIIATVTKQSPELIKPYVSKFILTINDFKVDAIKRNFLLALAEQKIPSKLQGRLINTCFEYMLSSTEPVAIKVHSMQIVANLCAEHPELIPELKSVIFQETEKNSAAFTARAKMIFKKLDKIKKK
ncbi:MAG: hypothetical protein JNL69_07125 [Bacteroidia bacterium]|nr:hypothetical protein [Bacteroidia bacterium]